MSGDVQNWLVMGLMFAGAPTLALARRWDAVRAGETLPRACGTLPAPKPAAPVRIPELPPIVEPAPAPAYAFLRLGRVDEGFDAERRAMRHEGLVRAGY